MLSCPWMRSKASQAIRGPGVPDWGFSGCHDQRGPQRRRTAHPLINGGNGDGGSDRACDGSVHGCHPGPGQPLSCLPVSMWESTAALQARGGRASVLFAGGQLPPHLEWVAPFGALSAANWLAMPAQWYMRRHGLTREHLCRIAVNARRNAALNPDAIYGNHVTIDGYLAARMICDPLCLFDCDSATAVIVSRRDATRGQMLSRSPSQTCGWAYPSRRFSRSGRMKMVAIACGCRCSSPWTTLKHNEVHATFLSRRPNSAVLVVPYGAAAGANEVQVRSRYPRGQHSMRGITRNATSTRSAVQKSVATYRVRRCTKHSKMIEG